MLNFRGVCFMEGIQHFFLFIPKHAQTRSCVVENVLLKNITILFFKYCKHLFWATLKLWDVLLCFPPRITHMGGPLSGFPGDFSTNHFPTTTFNFDNCQIKRKSSYWEGVTYFGWVPQKADMGWGLEYMILGGGFKHFLFSPRKLGKTNPI